MAVGRSAGRLHRAARCRRRTILPLVIALLVGAGALLPAVAGEHTLSFEDRVACQEAIERVYYSHQVGAALSFEEAVPRRVLERKVRNYLKQSAALALFWNKPVTARGLQREMERIARDTRFPGRLLEIDRQDAPYGRLDRPGDDRVGRKRRRCHAKIGTRAGAMTRGPTPGLRPL
jgi:hypothetical protein